ncbi:P-loop containing nucleoside triphosphate hydrolase protein [Pterulicium gracile]|uniref:P-loop containing nucleoside triphosphate hydrolase protein n=1 Tax=Pterulicium gracile TaxID=1884261 RepID=A0A5C3QVG7_9AGAR|nr:P-loop containing nucleoside triphosphate hydrolase protein [Pterula gracilis]
MTARPNQRKGKKAKKGEDDSGEVEEDDEGFEEEHGDKIRESVKAKQQIKGGVADHGIIERVRMENFMCHRHLQFDFGPQINFIIGHNGSGKSAVLSAITIALGGKSSSTGRGNGLKAFVREGDSQATVELTLKNQGDEAYKPDLYGKSILIIRKFTKDGSASWKICSADRTVISNQRQELSAICDHMNIQVDNPMSVLTQGIQFLSASDSHQKYLLFLRGTQLQQLSDEYDACHNNIRQTSKVLQQKSELVPELQEKYQEVRGRFAEAEKAREQHKKVETLRKELAWAHVAVKKKEFEQRVSDMTKKEARIEKIEENVAAEDVSCACSIRVQELLSTLHSLNWRPPMTR